MSGRASPTTDDHGRNGLADPVSAEPAGVERIERVDAVEASIAGSGESSVSPKRSETQADADGLTRAALAAITPDAESVRAAFVTPRGTRLQREDKRQYLPDSDGLLVTNRRLVFVRVEGGDRVRKSVAYGDIATLAVEEAAGTVVSCKTTAGERWRFELPADESAVVDAVRRHLEWIGAIRTRLRRFSEDLDTATERIRCDAQVGDWTAAKARYDRFRDRLDTLTCGVQVTEPVDDDVLAPELATLERQLERAHARLVVERAEAALDRIDSLVADEEYAQVASLVATTRDFHRQAHLHADSLQRGDGFRFGAQRELGEAIDRLGWRIETLAAEPLRAATEARIRARQADSPAEKRAHWEAALDRYRNLESLAGEDGPLAGVGDAITLGKSTAGKRLAELHWRLGRQHWIVASTADLTGSDGTESDHYCAAAKHFSTVSVIADAVDSVDAPEPEPDPAQLRELVDSLGGSDVVPTEVEIREAVDTHLDSWNNRRKRD